MGNGHKENTKQWEFARELRKFGDDEMGYLKEILDHGAMSIFDVDNGMVERFEKAFAEFQGAKFGNAKSSAMSGLMDAVGAAGCGVGDEVICDPVVHFGGLAAMYYNTVPVWADIDPDTWNVCPKSFEACITEHTKAAIITHVWGQMAEIDVIRDICRKHDIFLIEDCAHVAGAFYKGVGAGSYGDCGVFSFQEYKQLSTGDGGMLVTSDEKLMFNLTNTWNFSGESPLYVVGNSRMNGPTAAIGMGQLKKIDNILKFYGQTEEILEDAIKGCEWLVPRKRLPDSVRAPYWFSCKFEGDKVGLDYNKFKKLCNEMGSELRFGFNETAPYDFDFFRLSTAYRHPDCPIRCPIYTAKSNYRYKAGLCPNIEEVMPRLVTARLIFMSVDDANKTADILKKVISVMES